MAAVVLNLPNFVFLFFFVNFLAFFFFLKFGGVLTILMGDTTANVV